MLRDLIRKPERLLGVILAGSVFARVAAALYLGNSVTDMPGTFDQISYHTLAQQVLTGKGFSFAEPWWPVTAPGAPTAHWSFLYTLYLVVIYGLFGVQPLIGRLIQAVAVGILQPYLVYKLGQRIFNPWIGLIAAALTAGYIYFIYYTGSLLTEPFYITAILAVLYFAIRLVDRLSQQTGKHIAQFVCLGLLAGSAILLRQLFMLIIPFIFFWMLWSSPPGKRRQMFVGLLLSGLIIALMILPFSIYNTARFGQFVLLNTNSGYAFFWGNHPIYGAKFIPILPPEMGSYLDLIPKDIGRVDEATLEKELLKRGIQFVLDDPGRYILLSISRIPAYFMFWPSPDSGTISNFSRVFSFGITLPFMVLGLWFALRKHFSGWLAFSRSPMFLVLLFALLYTGVHLLTWALVRYRLPVDAVMLIFAGYGLLHLYGAVTHHPVLPGKNSQSPIE